MTSPSPASVEPISTADREKAKELCARATPGPWVEETFVTGRPPDAGAAVVASDDDLSISNPSRGIIAWVTRLVSRTNIQTITNARFIAFSRTAIPAYEARVVELEAALDNLVESSGKTAVRAEQLEDRLEASEASAVALLEALREAETVLENDSPTTAKAMRAVIREHGASNDRK